MQTWHCGGVPEIGNTNILYTITILVGRQEEGREWEQVGEGKKQWEGEGRSEEEHKEEGKAEISFKKGNGGRERCMEVAGPPGDETGVEGMPCVIVGGRAKSRTRELEREGGERGRWKSIRSKVVGRQRVLILGKLPCSCGMG